MSDTPDHPSPLPPAERLAERPAAHPTPRRSVAAKALHEFGQIDLAVYRAIAGTPTPTLDAPLRRLSGLANRSQLWLAIAATLFALGGRSGRRAAATGVVAVGVNSAVVNLPMKLASRRERPTARRPGCRMSATYQCRRPHRSRRATRRRRSRSGRGGFIDSSARCTPARSPDRGCLLARAHGRALPGRRHRRFGCRGDDRRGNRIRDACPARSVRTDVVCDDDQDEPSVLSALSSRSSSVVGDPGAGARVLSFQVDSRGKSNPRSPHSSGVKIAVSTMSVRSGGVPLPPNA